MDFERRCATGLAGLVIAVGFVLSMIVIVVGVVLTWRWLRRRA